MSETTVDPQKTIESSTTRKRSLWHPLELLRWCYDWVLHWAKTKYAVPALFVIAFMESSFFPIPPDLLIMALGVAHPNRAFWYAFVCTVGSVSGAMLGYAIGWGFWGVMDTYFYQFVPGFTPEKFNEVQTLFQENAFMTVFTAGFTPIPYKIMTIMAGVASLSIPAFIFASIVGRGARYFLLGGAFYYFGPSVKKYIDKYFDLIAIALTVLLVVALLAFKMVFQPAG